MLFVLLGNLQQRGNTEAQARIRALQARIRPHFLFNCFNTIAELVATDAAKAEVAVHSLSLLFRASLDSENSFHSLQKELNLCQGYLELERLRLDSRLNVQWQVAIAEAETLKVPKLILQPLIENALTHGMSEDGSVYVSIDLRETKTDISIEIKNRVAPASGRHQEGHGIALENIRERLLVLYDDKQTLRARQDNEYYRVLLRFPKAFDQTAV